MESHIFMCHVIIAANCWKKEIVLSLDHQTSNSVRVTGFKM